MDNIWLILHCNGRPPVWKAVLKNICHEPCGCSSLFFLLFTYICTQDISGITVEIVWDCGWCRSTCWSSSVIPREKRCVSDREERKSLIPQKTELSATLVSPCLLISLFYSLCCFSSGSCLLSTGFQLFIFGSESVLFIADPSWLPLQLFKIMLLQLIFMPTKDRISHFISRFGLDCESVNGFAKHCIYIEAIILSLKVVCLNVTGFTYRVASSYVQLCG